MVSLTKILCAFSICLIPLTVYDSHAAKADIVDVANDVYDGLSTFADLAVKAQQAQTDLQFIEKERKESPNKWPWDSAVKSFHSSADKISKAHFAINYKDGDFTLPSGDWGLCVNRFRLVQTIDSELNILNAAASSLSSLSSKLAAATDEVNKTQAALVQVQKLYVRLAHLSELHPLLKIYFDEKDALDISTKVEPALSTVREAVNGKAKNVNAALASVTQKHNNLATNKMTLTSVPCDLSGVYQLSDSGVIGGLMVTLNKTGVDAYGCADNRPEFTCSVRSASAANRTMTWWATYHGNQTFQWKFSISDDYTTMSFNGDLMKRQ